MHRLLPLHDVRARTAANVLPCVSVLACGAETPFSISTKETVR
jgi:hypothetical protein